MWVQISAGIICWAARVRNRRVAWQFYETAPSGINAVPTAATEPSARYDLNGRRLSNASTKGLVIEQYQDANGTTRTRKRF